MERIELDFATIISKNKDSLQDIISCSKEAYKTCFSFFNLKLKNKIKILVVDAEFKYKQESKDSYYPAGTCAFLSPRTFILKTPALMEKTTKWKKEQLINVITNGFAKAFYVDLVGSWKPLWLSGGIACYLMGEFNWTKEDFNSEFLNTDIKKLLQYNYVKKTYSKYKREFYPFSYLFVNFLIKKYGKKKFLKLLYDFSRNPEKKYFNGLFERIYSESVDSISKKILEDD